MDILIDGGDKTGREALRLKLESEGHRVVAGPEEIPAVAELLRQRGQLLRDTQEEIVSRLFAAREFRDEETGGHVRRIGQTSALLALALGLEQTFADDLRVAAAMHDIGKVGIPDAILQKPGKLTAEEFAVMKNHAAIGGRLLAGSELPVIAIAREVAEGHHERFDGKGYPGGIGGEDIPIAARIVAVADVFDALSTHRVYRPALEEEEVMAILVAGRGTHFDPRVLAAFLELLPRVKAIQAAYP